VFWPFIRFLQAGAYLATSDPRPALKLLGEAAEIAGGDSPEAPLFHVLHGDLSLIGPQPDLAEATRAYEAAFATSERYRARMSQLRAAVRLCRIAGEAERPARLEQLRDIHATFTEGFATRDLQEAAELLGRDS